MKERTNKLYINAMVESLALFASLCQLRNILLVYILTNEPDHESCWSYSFLWCDVRTSDLFSVFRILKQGSIYVPDVDTRLYYRDTFLSQGPQPSTTQQQKQHNNQNCNNTSHLTPLPTGQFLFKYSLSVLPFQLFSSLTFWSWPFPNRNTRLPIDHPHIIK